MTSFYLHCEFLRIPYIPLALVNDGMSSCPSHAEYHSLPGKKAQTLVCKGRKGRGWKGRVWRRAEAPLKTWTIHHSANWQLVCIMLLPSLLSQFREITAWEPFLLMRWLPYLEQKLFNDLLWNLRLLIAQAYGAHGIEDTFTKLWLTSRCGISLVFLSDELNHTSLLETTEQIGSVQDGIYELHWSEVKPYVSSQKSCRTIHWGSLGCQVALWPAGHSSSGRCWRHLGNYEVPETLGKYSL